MTRSVAEWKGRTHDAAIPPRVKVRIFERFRGRCAHCTRRLGGSLHPCYDHIVALINGGDNREFNIQLLCTTCHGTKTGSDVAEKATVYRKKAKHIGIERKGGRKIPGSKGSGWKKTFNHGWIKREP